MRRFLRVFLILLAALAIVGLASGAFKPGNRAAGGSGGGAESPSTTVNEVTPKIYCVVEQGGYAGLTVEVWENGEKLAPVDELDGDDPYYGSINSGDATGFDVYEVTPGQSEVRFVSYTANQEKKSGEIRAGSRWILEFDEDWTKIVYSTSPGTVSIPASAVSVFVFYSHL